MIKIGTALFEAAEQFEREKGISKEVLVSDDFSQEEQELAEKIKNKVNEKENLVLDIKLKSFVGPIPVIRISDEEVR